MEWRIKQDGLVVASGSADDAAKAKSEAARYAITYAQDGSPADLYYRHGKRWKFITRVEFVKAA